MPQAAVGERHVFIIDCHVLKRAQTSEDEPHPQWRPPEVFVQRRDGKLDISIRLTGMIGDVA